MPHIGLHAFIDEGDRARTKESSDHFVMSAVIIPATKLADASAALIKLRSDIHRQPSQVLSWKNIKSHSQRLRVVQTLTDLD